MPTVAEKFVAELREGKISEAIETIKTGLTESYEVILQKETNEVFRSYGFVVEDNAGDDDDQDPKDKDQDSNDDDDPDAQNEKKKKGVKEAKSKVKEDDNDPDADGDDDKSKDKNADPDADDDSKNESVIKRVMSKRVAEKK